MRALSAGYVGILSVDLYFPAAGSLKAKRKHEKSAKAQLQNRLAHPLQRSTITTSGSARLPIACVAREPSRGRVACSPTPSATTDAEATLLRIAQEALANIRKHARATRVVLTLTYLDDALLLDVRDDGLGFEPEVADRGPDGWQSGGFGLTAMRERLQQYGGTLTIESSPGTGTTIAAALPDASAGPANEEADRRAGMGATTGAR